MTIRNNKAGTFDIINVGDDVRSFDFPFNDDCYVEGKVREINDIYYLIDVSKRIMSGEEVDLEGKTFEVTVVKNGNNGFFGVSNGVELLKN